MAQEPISPRSGLVLTLLAIAGTRVIEFIMEKALLEQFPETLAAPIAQGILIIALYVAVLFAVWRVLGGKPILPVRDLERLIRKRQWRLHYQPGTDTSKTLGFAANGRVIYGPNESEHGWRMQNPQTLEILRDDGTVHNRFQWNAKRCRLESTNEPDVYAVAKHRRLGQYMEPF